MSHCHTCKFARWELSKDGRRNSRRPGRCTWKGKIVLPTSSNRPEQTFEGGYIWWKDKHKCPTYQKTD